MIVLGLTGSIGMGKTTAAGAFRRLGIPTYDADAAVHAVTEAGGEAVPLVQARFPDAVAGGAVDRARLGEAVFDDAAALAELEAILHPIVRRRRDRFLKFNGAAGRRLVVLDIPLLFETGGDRHCDAVAVVSAPAFLQRMRVMSRPGMTEEKFAGILARQMPDGEKRRRADFVIPTGLDRGFSLRRIRNVVRLAAGLTPGKWPPK